MSVGADAISKRGSLQSPTAAANRLLIGVCCDDSMATHEVLALCVGLPRKSVICHRSSQSGSTAADVLLRAVPAGPPYRHSVTVVAHEQLLAADNLPLQTPRPMYFTRQLPFWRPHTITNPTLPTRTLCTWGVLRVPRQYIGTETGLLGPGGDGVDCRLQ